eukprot:XP_001692980.1 predicted protein [Chlamydomonas reinhardtii]
MAPLNLGQLLGSRGLVALVLGPIACSALSLGGLAPEGSSAELQRVALAVLVLGCVLGTLSFVLVFLSVLEYAGRLFLARCFNYTIAHIVMAVLWLGEIGLSAYLLASSSPRLLPAVAFVAGGAVLAAAHAGFILVATCWCCCGGAFVGSPADLNPKSALLIFIPGSEEDQAAFGAYASLPTPTGQARTAPGGQHQQQRTPARGGAGAGEAGARKTHSVQPFAPQPALGQQLQPMRQ